MTVEAPKQFVDWYRQNRFWIESATGGFCLLQKSIYVTCNEVHEEIIGDKKLKVSPRILENYVNGMRSFSAEILISLENNGKTREILCAERKILHDGEVFCLPTRANFYLFKLKGIYRYDNSIYIGPLVLGEPINYKY